MFLVDVASFRSTRRRDVLSIPCLPTTFAKTSSAAFARRAATVAVFPKNGDAAAYAPLPV